MAENEQPRRSRGRRIRRTVLWALAGVLVAAMGTGAWLYNHFSGSLNSVDINAELGTDRPAQTVGGAQDILVLGSDSLASAPPEADGDSASTDPAAPTDPTDGPAPMTAGSGSAMVIHLPSTGGTPTVVNIPRDLVVDRPECAKEVSTDRIMFHAVNAAGGPSCVVKTVEQMSDIRMDHYIEVDFAGFGDLVDALGGVTITTTEPVHDEESGLALEPGTHLLDGATALTAVRSRQATAPGATPGGLDLQQQFLLALIHEVNRQEVLSNPTKLYRVAEAATASLTTDSELGSLTDLVDFANELSEVDTGAMTTLALPVDRDATAPGRAELRRPEADTVWQALKSGRTVR